MRSSRSSFPYHDYSLGLDSESIETPRQLAAYFVDIIDDYEDLFYFFTLEKLPRDSWHYFSVFEEFDYSPSLDSKISEKPKQFSAYFVDIMDGYEGDLSYSITPKNYQEILDSKF